MKPRLLTNANSAIRARIGCCECAKSHYLQSRSLPARLQLPDLAANAHVLRSLRKNQRTCHRHLLRTTTTKPAASLIDTTHQSCNDRPQHRRIATRNSRFPIGERKMAS